MRRLAADGMVTCCGKIFGASVAVRIVQYRRRTRAIPASMLEKFDVEQFIERIRRYPIIWDLSCREHKDKNKIREAWINVCTEFCGDFGEKSEREKNKICTKYMNKWRNIRDQFRKTVRKRGGSGLSASGRRYIYARQLSFLLESSKTTVTDSSSNNEENTEEVSTLETNKEINPLRSQRPLKRRREKSESSPSNYLQSSIASEVDDDRSFFESVLPTVRTFTIDQKLEFRSEVLNIIRNIRLAGKPTALVTNFKSDS